MRAFGWGLQAGRGFEVALENPPGGWGGRASNADQEFGVHPSEEGPARRIHWATDGCPSVRGSINGAAVGGSVDHDIRARAHKYEGGFANM